MNINPIVNIFGGNDSSSEASGDEDGGFPVLPRRRRNFKDRVNFENTEGENRSRFRSTDGIVEFLEAEIGQNLKSDTDRNYALTPRQSIKLALRYLATGDNFTTIADAHGVSKATLSRKLHAVVSDINKKFMNQEINFPQGNDMVEAVNAFRSIGTRYGQRGLPCVIGAVDGTLLKIRAPKQNEEQFVDRHGNHSINAMAVCGPDMKFSYISARWPGSVADGRVFRNSSLCTQLENGWRPYPNGFLIGDSGYASNIYLLTPYAVDNNQAIRQNYNRVHKGTRRMIECAFGLLKQRFRCLLGTMQLDPSFACQVFICCCILHNLIIDDNDRDAIAQLIGELDGEGQGQDGQNDDINDTASGEIRRSQIAQLLLAV